MSDELLTIDHEGIMISEEAEDTINKVYSMSNLDLPKVAEFEIDDGPEGHALVESLLAYLKDFEGHLLRIGSYDAEKVTQPCGAGKFLFYLA